MELADETSSKSVGKESSSSPQPSTSGRKKSPPIGQGKETPKSRPDLALVKVANAESNNNDRNLVYSRRFFEEMNSKVSKGNTRRNNSKIDVPQQFLTLSLVQYICNLLYAKNSELIEIRFQG
jgi:hypothetical protein